MLRLFGKDVERGEEELQDFIDFTLMRQKLNNLCTYIDLDVIHLARLSIIYDTPLDCNCITILLEALISNKTMKMLELHSSRVLVVSSK